MIPFDVINSILVLYYTSETFSLLFYSISFALDKDLRLTSYYSPTPKKKMLASMLSLFDNIFITQQSSDINLLTITSKQLGKKFMNIILCRFIVILVISHGLADSEWILCGCVDERQ